MNAREAEAAATAASEARLIAALEGWVRCEIERLCEGGVFKSCAAYFDVGSRRVEHLKHSMTGFASAEDAARACVDELLSSWWTLAGSPDDAIVWRVAPELTCRSTLRRDWKFYVRYQFVRVQPGERLVLGECLEMA